MISLTVEGITSAQTPGVRREEQCFKVCATGQTNQMEERNRVSGDLMKKGLVSCFLFFH